MMNEDKFWNNLSSDWKKSTDENIPNDKEVKKKIRSRKIKAVLVSLLELAITLAVGFLFFKGLNDKSLSFLLWVGFGFVFGVITTSLSVKNRLLRWRPLKALNTKELLEYELRHAINQKAYAKLLKYGTIIFCVFFHIWFFVAFIEYDPFNFNMSSVIIYCSCMAWFGLFGIYSYQLRKNTEAQIIQLGYELNLFKN